ncbi:MAG: SIMPL domain-containing protein [Sphingomonadaceae bacterium]
MPARAEIAADLRALAENPLVTVQVSDSVETSPDSALIHVGVQTPAPTASAALAQNSREMEQVLAAIRAAGIAQRDIQTTGIMIHPQYDYEGTRRGMPPRLTGYQASNSVQVTIDDIGSIGAFLDRIVTAGGTSVSGPHFTVSDPDPLLREARANALRKADALAAEYARARGYSRARLVSVQEGGFHGGGPIVVTGSRISGLAAPPPPPPPPVAPGQVSTGVTLAVQYILER